jgi:16S rRNA (cytidine1402-2'-O)-methyltransferase
VSIETGILYVVATPIGNLGDMTRRAVETLAAVDAVAAEDTRHTGRLLSELGLRKPLVSLHEHNEAQRTESLIPRLLAGEHIALVSDAGTPLISDPGYRLVQAARGAGVRIVPIPGPSASIAALSASGLPTDRFVFEGFLPAKSGPRRARIAALAREPRTLVFYESAHRVLAMLRDLAQGLEPDRPAVIARELTKLHEELRAGRLEELLEALESAPERQRGEFVILVQGCPEPSDALRDDARARELLGILLDELSVKQSARLAARILGGSRNELYGLAVELDSSRHAQNEH